MSQLFNLQIHNPAHMHLYLLLQCSLQILLLLNRILQFLLPIDLFTLSLFPFVNFPLFFFFDFASEEFAHAHH